MKEKPLAHQVQFLKWAKGRRHIPQLSEQGTGKTYMALSWLEGLRHSKTNPAAILCESSFIDTWLESVTEFTDLKAVGVKGSLSKKIKALSSPDPVKVIGYDSLATKLLPNLMSVNWSVCIADESTNMKRYKSKQTKKAIKIFERANNRMIMTGTPFTNSLFDIWSQFLFLDGGETFGRSFWDFRFKYFKPWGFDWKPKAGTYDMFQSILAKKAFRVLKKDCLDLPPKIKCRIPVELDSKAQKIYDGLFKDWIYELDDGTVIESKYIVQKMSQFALICSGWVKDTRISSTKHKVLENLLLDIKDRSKGIVIWCRFNREVLDVVEICEKLKLSGVTFTGNDSAKEVVEAFQKNEKLKVFITTLKKGAKAITLTKASHVIYYGVDYDYELATQSEDRTHRIGSEVHDRIQYYYLYTKNSVEQSAIESVKTKSINISKALPKKELQNLIYPSTNRQQNK